MPLSHIIRYHKRVTERIASNVPQLTFNTTRSKVVMFWYFCNDHKCTKWPENDLEWYKAKGSHMLKYYPRVPISPDFALRLLVFQIYEVFGCSMKKVVKIGNWKFQKSPMYFCEDHWEESSGQVWKPLTAICRRSCDLKLFLLLGLLLMKRKNIR